MTLLPRLRAVVESGEPVSNELAREVLAALEASQRSLLATQTELDQMRRLHWVSDHDLVRLALSAWAAMVEVDDGLAGEALADLPGMVGGAYGRRMLRLFALEALVKGRTRAGLAYHWEQNGRPNLVERLRREAMAWRFRAMVLLEVARCR